jgi:ribosome biogenesis GTPase A
MLGGGRVNLQKTAEIVLTDFRTAILGRITLETPAEFEVWRETGLLADAERTLRKEARKVKTKKPQRGDPPEVGASD